MVQQSIKGDVDTLLASCTYDESVFLELQSSGPNVLLMFTLMVIDKSSNRDVYIEI